MLTLMLAMLAGTAHAQSEYRVRAGDTLVIEVLEDSSLNRSVAVLPDVRFSFPFAGTLQAAGRTVGEIQSAVSTAIESNYATPPTVFVTVQPGQRAASTGGGTPQTATIDIYFVGEVGQPGLRPVEPGTTFLQAMSQAGGLSPFAATKRIQLHRTDASGRKTTQIFNYHAISRGAKMLVDPPLRDGDVILVPERRLFE